MDWLTEKETVKWSPATEADLPREVQALMSKRPPRFEKAVNDGNLLDSPSHVTTMDLEEGCSRFSFMKYWGLVMMRE